MTRFLPVSLIALTGLLAACNNTPTIISSVDASPPTVSLSAAVSNAAATSTVSLTATASDNVGVTKVEFYDGSTLIATDTSAPYTASTTYAYAANGTHTYTAKAYDAQGNTASATASATSAVADANESNDTAATATALSIGTPLNGAIAGQARDVDYFKFTAAAGDQLKLNVRSVSVNASSTLDPYVMILLPDGKTVLEKDDDSGAGLESEIRFNAPAAGTYYVVVTSFTIHNDPLATGTGDNLATNTYQISLTRR